MAKWGFGKSEKELEEWEEDLGKRENACALETSKLEDKDRILKQEQETLIQKVKTMSDKESDLSLREINAKNEFALQQEESFAKTIAKQLEQIEERKVEIASLEENFAKRLQEVVEKEGLIGKRERSIKEREIEADADFGSKNKVLLDELERKEELIRSLEEGYQEKLEQFQEKLKQYNNDIQELNRRKEILSVSEIERDEGYAKERELLLQEFSEKRLAANREFDIEREKRFLELENELNQKQEKEKENLEQEKLTLKEQRHILEEDLDGLEFDKQRVKAKEEILEREKQKITEEIEKGIKERKKSFDHDVENIQNENDSLRESIDNSRLLLGVFDELKRKLGNEDPEKILLKLKTNIEEIRMLKEELLERPTKEMIDTVDSISAEKNRYEETCKRLSEDNSKLKEMARNEDELHLEIENLRVKVKSYEDRNESISADNNRLKADLKRINASYEREEDREKRINDIRLPYFKKILPRSTARINELTILEIDEERPFTELEWLENIRYSCEDYGLNFSKRMLYAFHTALKTSEWSPLTVLAGVSGTGKSELPRLYSHFGGINFLSLAVQPNWDSQESMLGFFNSIDNEFDAQPVLRLLAQSQEEQNKEYPEGLKDTMSLVLLDEMNLAYVELYFADFLSKLELRRGKKGDDVPSLEIKLGAGVPPLELPLGRNVLWTGTMNQDETTKSLSDKVLDRGMILHFPRPTSFERRKKLKPLPEQAPLLDRKLWESWWVKESKFTDDQIKPFKEFMESINNYLDIAGRALGHRVWQSIEYYMANYPEVQQAIKDSDDVKLHKLLKIAFEDQLVLKVMPKLRGIETRGKSKSECLDKIRQLLDDNEYAIVDDFDTACDAGYGQFMWNSAKYLESQIQEEFSQNKKNNFIVKVISKAKDGEEYFYCKVLEGILSINNDVQITRSGHSIFDDQIKSIIKKGNVLSQASSEDGSLKVSIHNYQKIDKDDELESK